MILLELCRAHTPCARYAICSYRDGTAILPACHEHTYILTILTSVLGLVMREQKPACCIILSRLPVDRRGYDGQQKGTMLVERVPRFEAH
jgi:hypothetical protein